MRIIIPVLAAVTCMGGLMLAHQQGLLGSINNSTEAMEEIESPQSIATRLSQARQGDATKQFGSAQTEKDARHFIAKMQELSADTKTAGNALKNVKHLLRGRTTDRPEFRAAVARQLLERFPGTNFAAEGYRYQIAEQFQRNFRVDHDLTAKLDDFSKSYPKSELPVHTYKWVCEQLSDNRDHRTALALAKHAVDASRPYRDVKKLEGFYRMTRDTQVLLNRMGPSSSGNRRSNRKTAKSGQVTGARFNQFLGKPFSLDGKTNEGYSFSSSSIQGNVTVVHFWATWCPSCRKITPKIRSVYDEWSSQGVKFVGVNLDRNQEAAKDFINGSRLAWPHLMSDEGGWQSRVARENKISSIPRAFVLDADGKVVEAGLSSVKDINEALTIHAGN